MTYIGMGSEVLGCHSVVIVGIAWATATIISVVASVIIPVVNTIVIPGLGGSTHVHPRGGRVCSLRDGVVHSNTSSIQLETITLLLGICRIICVFEIDKSKPTRTASQVVIDYIDVLQFSISAKYLLQVLLRRVETQTKYTHNISRIRVKSVSFVPLPGGHRGA